MAKMLLVMVTFASLSRMIPEPPKVPKGLCFSLKMLMLFSKA